MVGGGRRGVKEYEMRGKGLRQGYQ